MLTLNTDAHEEESGNINLQHNKDRDSIYRLFSIHIAMLQAFLENENLQKTAFLLEKALYCLKSEISDPKDS